METKGINDKFTHHTLSDGLKDYIECFWEHRNNDIVNKSFTVFPDSFFKMIIEWKEGKLKAYFLTGIWTKEVVITIPANTILVSIKFKLLAINSTFRIETKINCQ